MAELISTIQEHGHPILATIDVKDLFLMVPLQPEDQTHFATLLSLRKDNNIHSLDCPKDLNTPLP